MKNFKTNRRFFNLRSAIIICLIASCTFVSCSKDSVLPPVDKDGLTEAIRNILPDDTLEKLKDLGIEINGGSTPPNIEGTYDVAPVTLVKSNFADGYSPGKVFAAMRITFSKQDNAKQTITINYTQGSAITSDLGSYITGSGNKFTVFAEVETTKNESTYKAVEVYSGEITPDGIKNFYTALIVTLKASWSINVGEGRLLYDSDGFSERITSTRSIPSASYQQSITTTSSEAFLPGVNSK